MSPIRRRIITVIVPILPIPFSLPAWVASKADFVANTGRNNQDLNPGILAVSPLVNDCCNLNHRLPAQTDIPSFFPDNRGMLFSGRIQWRYRHCALRQQSVLDIDCKVLKLDKRYVVDANIFPSRGVVSPSFMAIANALRIGGHLLRRFT